MNDNQLIVKHFAYFCVHLKFCSFYKMVKGAKNTMEMHSIVVGSEDTHSNGAQNNTVNFVVCTLLLTNPTFASL